MFQNSYRIRAKSKQTHKSQQHNNIFRRVSPIHPRGASIISLVQLKQTKCKNKLFHKKYSNSIQKNQSQNYNQNNGIKLYCENINRNKDDKQNIDTFIRRQVLKSQRKKMMKLALIKQQDQYRKNFISTQIKSRKSTCRKKQQQNNLKNYYNNQNTLNVIGNIKQPSIKQHYQSQKQLSNREKIAQCKINFLNSLTKQQIQQIMNNNHKVQKNALQKSIRSYRMAQLRKHSDMNMNQSFHELNQQLARLNIKSRNTQKDNKFQISRWQNSSMQFPDVYSRF